MIPEIPSTKSTPDKSHVIGNSQISMRRSNLRLETDLRTRSPSSRPSAAQPSRWAAFDRSGRGAVIVRNLRGNYETLYNCAALGARRCLRGNRQLRAGRSGTIKWNNSPAKEGFGGLSREGAHDLCTRRRAGDKWISSASRRVFYLRLGRHTNPRGAWGGNNNFDIRGLYLRRPHADPPDRKHCSRKVIDCPRPGQRQAVNNSRGVTASMVNVCRPTRRFRAI